MPKSDKPRMRPRKFVMVELTEVQRAKLEALCAKRAEKSGVKETLAGTIRKMIMEAK